MRYIKTENNLVELIETGANGQVVNSRGFMYGQLYFLIKGKKVTFYLIDNETPWRNDVWSIDIPFMLDNEWYSTPEEASAVLHKIMDDSFQEQLDALKEDTARIDQSLTDEIARSTDKDDEHDAAIEALNDEVDALDDKIDAEITRSREKDAAHDALLTHIQTDLQNEITRSTTRDTQLENALNAERTRALEAEEDIDDKIDAEITRANAEETRIEGLITNEIARSTAKDAEMSAQLSGITTLNDEVAQLTTNLQAEITRSTSKDTAHDALLSTLTDNVSTLTTNLQNETNRSTSKDAEHDAILSGLNNSINSEIQRATNAENALRNDLNAERTRALAAEEDIDDKIDNEITRANSEETRLEGKIDGEITRATAKDVEHDTLLGTLSTNVSTLTTDLQNEVTRATSKDAAHDTEILSVTNSLNSEIQRAQGAENGLRSDLTEAVHDIETISGSVSSLSDEIDDIEQQIIATSSYTKTEIDTKLNEKANKSQAVANVRYDSINHLIEFHSIDGVSLGTVDCADFIVDGMVDNVEIVGDNLVVTFNTDSGKSPISIPLADIFNPSNYYDKTDVDALLNDKQDTLTAGDGITISGDVISFSSEKESAISTALNELKEQKLDASAYTPTDLSDYYTKSEVDDAISQEGSTKQNTLTAGHAIDITNDTVSFTLPISASTGTNSIVIGAPNNTANGINSFAIGLGNQATADNSHAEGASCVASGNASHAEGVSTATYNEGAHAEGGSTEARGRYSHTEGYHTVALNPFEHASGHYNVSVSGSTDAQRTLFTVGNGHNNTRHNALQIMQNGDIYLNDDKKLQDYTKFKLWSGTQAEYEALTKEADTLYIII